MSLFKGEQPTLGTTVVNPSRIDDDALTIQAADSGQTGKLLSLKNSAGTVVASISNAGATVGVSNRIMVNSELLAASVDKWVFIADRAYTVKSIKEIHSVAGGAAAAVAVRKVTADASAPGAGAGANVKELLTAGFDLTATANTLATGTLTATTADLSLAAGDRIGLDFSGTLTGLVGILTIELQPA